MGCFSGVISCFRSCFGYSSSGANSPLLQQLDGSDHFFPVSSNTDACAKVENWKKRNEELSRDGNEELSSDGESPVLRQWIQTYEEFNTKRQREGPDEAFNMKRQKR